MKQRSDKKKNIDKVTASLIKNPLQSNREIEKDTWISRTTVWKVKANLDKGWHSKDNRVISLTDWDFRMMQRIQNEKNRRMDEEKGDLNNSDLNQWDKTAQARYTLFRGSVTDDEWGLKEPLLTGDILSKMTADELEEKRKALLWD